MTRTWRKYERLVGQRKTNDISVVPNSPHLNNKIRLVSITKALNSKTVLVVEQQLLYINKSLDS